MASDAPCIGYGALFDLDGVLINTEPEYTRIWNEIDARFPTGVEGFALKIKGTTLPDIMARYYPDPDTDAEVRVMLAEREEAMPYPLFDGVLDFLQALAREGIPAAIVTSSGDVKMQRLFGMYPGFRDFFGAVVTDSMVTHSKPHPEGYLLGAAMLGVPSERCVVFEDSFNGLRAGRAAGGRVVALATSIPRNSLAGLADEIIDSFVTYSPEKMKALFR